MGKATSDADDVFAGLDRKNGTVNGQELLFDLIFGSNSELRAPCWVVRFSMMRKR